MACNVIASVIGLAGGCLFAGAAFAQDADILARQSPDTALTCTIADQPDLHIFTFATQFSLDLTGRSNDAALIENINAVGYVEHGALGVAFVFAEALLEPPTLAFTPRENVEFDQSGGSSWTRAERGPPLLIDLETGGVTMFTQQIGMSCTVSDLDYSVVATRFESLALASDDDV